MKKILLVDDSIEAQDSVRRVLSDRYEYTLAMNLTQARQCLATNSYDVVISEAVLPDGNGFAFCEEIKKNSPSVVVIFLTDRLALQDKIQGFLAGADDYLVKPFEPLELSVRVDARLRKSIISSNSVAATPAQDTTFQKGDLILSVPFQRVMLREGGVDRDLRLTPTEFRLLYFFIQNENGILTRTQLLSTIWSDDVHVLTRTIDKHISTLKKKLGNRSGYIQSVHNKGYRFTIQSTSSQSRLDNFGAIAEPV